MTVSPFTKISPISPDELTIILSAPFRSRFASKFKQSDSGCFEWVGTKDRHGYGMIKVGRRSMLAHRVSKIISLGSTLERNKFVCHTCDNRSCINPDHLWIGSNADNMADMKAKGRSHLCSRPRERRADCKITVADIEQMRRLKAQGMQVKDIAARFSTHPNYAGRLINHTPTTTQRSV